MLVRLGILSGEDYDSAQAHLSRARVVEDAARAYQQGVAEHAGQIAANLFAAETLTEDAILTAATAIPEEAQVKRVASALWIDHVQAAHGIAFANRGSIADTLNAAFDELVSDFKAVSAKLGDARTPQQAIHAKKVTEWSKLSEIAERLDKLVEIRSTARKYYLIATPDGYGFGAAWLYREPLTDEVRALANEGTDFGDLAAVVLREPWAPPTPEAAREVAEQWNEAEA
ncbi:hypothetical protein GTC6_20545 [Gordonia terrae C-6]|uniref:Uncharacterized protein n=2 Tax=Gordonia terrae TaxID=2055 RepID=R7Y493_9ACTN|nr:hypothetical protein GTC6_20545 [Gordonia terrae C-6]